MALKSYSSKTASKKVLINGNQAKETRFKIKKYTAKSRCKAGHTIENKGTGNYRLALESLFFIIFLTKIGMRQNSARTIKAIFICRLKTLLKEKLLPVSKI